MHARVLVLIHGVTPTKPLWFREGGFPLAWDRGDAVPSGVGAASDSDDEDWTAAAVDGRCSLIANLWGYDDVVPAQPHGLDTQGTNVRYTHSLVPQLRLTRTDARPFVLASLVAGGGNEIRPRQLRSAVVSVAVDTDAAFDEAELTVAYADGSRAHVRPATGEVRWECEPGNGSPPLVK